MILDVLQNLGIFILCMVVSNIEWTDDPDLRRYDFYRVDPNPKLDENVLSYPLDLDN